MTEFQIQLPHLPKLPKIDLKKVIYLIIAILVVAIIVIYFLFFQSFEVYFTGKYLTKANNYPKAALQELKAVYLQLMIISLAIFFVSFLFGLILYKIVRKPLDEFKYAMRQVIDGDFEMRMPVKGLSEFAALYDDFNTMIKCCRKKITLTNYVSDSTAKMIEVLKTGEITTQPRRKLLTILFTDVRGFTTYAEQHDPIEVVQTINELLAIQVDIIKKNSGDILKFVGDEIMAEFPEPGLAFKSAVEIQQKVAVFNKKREEPLHLGIGINYGEAVVGAIGSGNCFDWTTIGHTVNLGRRLCGAAAPGEIYISDAVYQQLKTKRKFTNTSLKVKGLSKKVDVYYIKDKDL